MSTGFYINGVLIETMYGPKGASTAAVTGIQINGVDLNQLVLALADGQTGPTSNVKSNGADLKTFFGIPLTSLPINGQTFAHSYSIPAGGTGFTSIGFDITGGNTWQVYAGDPSTARTVLSSGSIPAGAVSVMYAFGTYTIPANEIDAGGSTTNNAASATAVSSNPSAYYTTATWGGASGSRGRSYPFTITFYNSSNSVISTTNITLVGETDGSA